jgi:hypothetical protein
MRTEGVRTAIGLAAILAVLMTAACSTTAPRWHVSPEVGYYDIDGTVTAEGELGNLKVTGKTDSDDMGLDNEVGFSPDVWAEWDDFLVGLTTLWVNFSGTGTAEETLTWKDRDPIYAGSDIKSDVTVSYLTATGLYRLLGPEDLVELGVGPGLGAAEYDLKVKGQGAAGGSVETDGFVPFGFLALHVWKDFGHLGLMAGVQGISVNIDDDDIDYYELVAKATVNLWGGPEEGSEGSLLLGYRYLKFHYVEDNPHGKLKVRADIQGPFVSLVISF